MIQIKHRFRRDQKENVNKLDSSRGVDSGVWDFRRQETCCFVFVKANET